MGRKKRSGVLQVNNVHTRIAMRGRNSKTEAEHALAPCRTRRNSEIERKRAMSISQTESQLALITFALE